MSRYIFEQLDTTDQAQRENLYRNNLDPTARQHMERALSHSREAYIATKEIGKARSGSHLVGDLEKVAHLTEKLRKRQEPNITIKPIRI